jgi:taurine dioxygenase
VGIHTGAPYGTRHAPPSHTQTREGSIVMDRQNPGADVETPHPVVCRHPGSGRPLVYVNPIYTIRFEDRSREESAALLNRIYTHCTRPEFCCRHRWQSGTIALWDNRSTMHFAVNDYDGQRRLLYRTAIAGERLDPYFGKP